MNKEEEKINEIVHKISEDIFKNGLLLSYSIGFWDGKVRQSEDDVVVVQKAQSAPEIFERGTKLLLPPESIKPFHGYRTKLFNFLSMHSFAVPGLRGSRFIPKSVYPNIKSFLEKEQESFIEDVDMFLSKYPAYRESQIKTFKQKYPSATDQISDLYPSEEYLRNRFYYTWMPYAWDYKSIEEIENEAKGVLAQRATHMISEASATMRNEIYAELNSAIASIKSSKNKVNIRTIARLEQKIRSLKQINIFGDSSLDELLERSAEVVGSIKTWTKEDLSKDNFDIEIKRLVRDVGSSIKAVIENPIEEISLFRKCASILDVEEEDDDVGDIIVKRSSKVIEL
jgi:hypothetical protein